MKLIKIKSIALLIYFCLLFCSIIYGKNGNTSTVKLKQYYKKCGVIFDAKYTLSVKNLDLKSRYTPSIDDIKKAEEILLNFIKTDTIFLTKKEKNKLYKKYYRQYYGYINQTNDKIIVIQLLNITNHKKFPDWKRNYSIGTGDYYERRTAIYYVDITNDGMIKLPVNAYGNP